MGVKDFYPGLPIRYLETIKPNASSSGVWMFHWAAGAIGIGAAVGIFLLMDAKLAIVFLCGSLYTFLLFRRAEMAIAIVILVVHNLFGFIDEETFRISGIFKLRDILLLSLFLPLIREAWRKTDLTRLIESPVSKCVGLVLLLSVFIIVKTSIEHDISIAYALRDGRRYFYYGLYFAILYHIRTPRQFTVLINIIIALGVIYSLLVIIQVLQGPSHIIFPAASDDELARWKVVPIDLEGFIVARAYISGFDLALLAFAVTLYRAVFEKSSKFKLLSFLCVCIIAIQIVFSFARAYWIGTLVALVVSTIFLIRDPKRILSLVAAGILIMVALEITVSFLPGKSLRPLALINKRAGNLQKDVFDKSGSFGWRLEDNAERIALVKENLFFGVGFVHDQTGKFRLGLGGRGLRTADSGLLSVFLDMGLIGATLILLMITLVLYRCYTAFKHGTETWEKGVLYGCFVYGVISLVAAFTWPAFVSYETIVPMVVVMSAQEIISRQIGGRGFNDKSTL